MRGNNCFVKRCHALGRITRAILVLATLASAARPVPGGSVVHVAPGGNDRNPGTATAPVVTLARAYERVKDSPQPREIVIHEGVYVGGVQLGRREDRLGGPRPHILIRAANRSDGSFERVVFDGARKIDAATIVPGAPGVFRIAKPDQYSPGRPPQMWESESRKRYTLVADLAAVRHYPASYWVGDEDIYFHTSDGRPPQDHEVGLSWHSNGISLWRTDMTLRGIEFRNCLTWSYSCGAGLFAARAAIEDCRAWNTVRGFYSWGGVPGGRIVRCRTDDVGTGVFCQGIGTQVEDCRLFKLRDDFLVPCHEQDDCGIHYYSPAEDGEIRGNLIVGFREGILLKCRSQKFRVEHNTCVGFTTIGLGSLAYHPEGVYRLNICVGPGTPLAFIDGLKSTTVMDYNLAWGYNNRFMPQTLRKSFAKTGTGASTIFADPRFAAPSLGDYRLLPSSPAVAKGPNGETLGALGVAGLGFQDKEPPTVSLALEKPARHESDSGNLWVPECAWLGGANALARTEKLRCPEWLSPGRPIALAIKAADNLGQIRQMRVQVGNGPWGPAEPFQTGMKLTLPEAWQFGPVRVQVCDAAGNWSEPATALVRVASRGPQLLGRPAMRANRFGAVLTFRADRPCRALVEFGPSPQYGSVSTQHEAWQRLWLPGRAGSDVAEARRGEYAAGRIVLLAPKIKSGLQYHYRLVLEDALGNRFATEDASFTATGEPKQLYVSPRGDDSDEGGTRDRPWRTIQYAVDRALPGDRVMLLPGFYPGEATITHRGLPEAPITIEADRPGTVVLDGRRAVPCCLRVEKASHVVIKGLEIRWFQEAGVSVIDSPSVSVCECRVWNKDSLGWVNGSGLVVRRSPGFVATRNVIYTVETGMFLLESPRSRLTHNTVLWNMFGAAYFLRSAAHSVCRNNCFAFSGNQMIRIGTAGDDELARFDCDYNNLGTRLLDPSPPHSLQPQDPLLRVNSKTMVEMNGVYFSSLEEWRKASGKDRHSIFADPKYVSPATRDFRLHPDSPNRGAGENGATIGALDVAAGRVAPSGASLRRRDL